MPLLRSFRIHLNSPCYKYFVPTGLIPLTITAIILTIAIVNSRVHGAAVDTLNETSSSPQEQMQFPENLDYRSCLPPRLTQLQPTILKRHSLHPSRLARGELIHAWVIGVVHEIFNGIDARFRAGIPTEGTAERR
jgi:hypothetical protein